MPLGKWHTFWIGCNAIDRIKMLKMVEVPKFQLYRMKNCKTFYEDQTASHV